MLRNGRYANNPIGDENFWAITTVLMLPVGRWTSGRSYRGYCHVNTSGVMTPQKDILEKKVLELSLLYEISRLLSTESKHEEALHQIMCLLSSKTDMQRGIITLLKPGSEEIWIETAFGLTEKEKRRGQYKCGEGVIGRVVESGFPMVVPNINESSFFLNRTRSRNNINEQTSFICVPIKLRDNILGTFSVDVLFKTKYCLEETKKLLVIIASIIAQAVHIRREMDLEHRRLLEENEALKLKISHSSKGTGAVVGSSLSMKQVYKLVYQVAKSRTTVLLHGESGTGKERIAEMIHQNSLRSEGPIIKLNCAVLPEALFESELFGHEKGAFTGASAKKLGRFELARGGTIFLDEIGELTMQVQVKLLRVIQEKEFELVGGSETIKTDVRIITATNRNLLQLVEEGKFREDLFYRLNVFPIYIPPLKERKSDIAILAAHFLKKYTSENEKEINSICNLAVDMLLNHDWPGNVRELENCIERAVILATDDIIHAYHLPPTLQAKKFTNKVNLGLEGMIEDFEREIIIDKLKRCNGNQSEAARELKTTYRIISYKVQKYGIDPHRYYSKGV